MNSSPTPESPAATRPGFFGRFSGTAVTVGSLIVCLALLATGLFALAGNARDATDSSLRLHALDDAQVNVVDVENQLRLLLIANGLDTEFSDVADLALMNGEAIVTDKLLHIGSSLEVAELDGVTSEFVDTFELAAQATLVSAQTRSLIATDATLTAELLPASQLLLSTLEMHRSELIESISAANAVLTALRTFTTFVVVHLVPTAGLLMYRMVRAVPTREKRLATRTASLAAQRDDTIVAMSGVIDDSRSKLLSAQRAIALAGNSAELRHVADESANVDLALEQSSELIAAAGDQTSTSFTDVDLVEQSSGAAAELGVIVSAGVTRALVRADARKIQLVLREMLLDAVSIAGVEGVRPTLLTEHTLAKIIVSHKAPDDLSDTLSIVFEQETPGMRRLAAQYSNRSRLLLAQTLLERMGGELSHSRTDGATVQRPTNAELVEGHAAAR
ncbi:MAG: hypothetical protein ACI8Y4_000937 [Candidatus Poriferisodalaceae bacterium]